MISSSIQVKRIKACKGIAVSRLSVVYVVLTAITFFSLVYGWVPFLNKQAYIAIIAILVSLIISPKYFTSKQFFISFFYAIIVWINAQRGDEYTFDKTIMDGLLLGMSGSLSFYLMESDDQKAKKWISILVMLIVIIQTVPSLLMYIVSQETIRSFIDLIYHGDEEMDWMNLYRMGILNYDVTHSLPMLVPPIMMWLRTKGASKIWKLFCAVSLMCVIVLCYIYDVTTVQLLVFFSIVVSFLIYPNQNKANRQRLIIATVLILPFMFSTTLQDGVLSGVEKISEGQLKDKIADARYNLTHDSNTGDMANRSEQYMLSLDSFIKSPIWGTDDDNKIGFHSAIFDRMGAFGLLGIVPFLIILFLCVKECRVNMSISSRWYFIICIICFLTLLLLKNMSRLEEWMMFFVVAPSLLTLNRESFKYSRGKSNP